MAFYSGNKKNPRNTFYRQNSSLLLNLEACDLPNHQLIITAFRLVLMKSHQI
jgi:hypothetical protein